MKESFVFKHIIDTRKKYGYYTWNRYNLWYSGKLGGFRMGDRLSEDCYDKDGCLFIPIIVL